MALKMARLLPAAAPHAYVIFSEIACFVDNTG